MPRKGRKFRGMDAGPGWIVREFSDIWRAIRELRAARSLEAASIGDGGIIVKGKGGFKMIAPDGTVIFEVICDPYNPDPDGNPQPSVFIHRNDGTVAFSLNDPIPNQDGYYQFVRIWDRAGHEIFAEDATAGRGIANPWLPFAMFQSRYTDWPKSTSGTFEEVWVGQYQAKNPTLSLAAKFTSDAPDTSGQCRFKANGTVVGSTQSFGFGIGTAYLAVQAPLPAGIDINDFVTVSLEVQRTAGTGNVMCAPWAVTGSQSA